MGTVCDTVRDPTTPISETWTPRVHTHTYDLDVGTHLVDETHSDRDTSVTFVYVGTRTYSRTTYTPIYTPCTNED